MSSRPEDDWPEGVEPPPPIKLPEPDGLAEPNQFTKVNQARAKKAAKEKRRNKKRRTHPTDPYEPLKKKKSSCSCCGCGGCFFLILLVIGLLIGGGYFAVAPFMGDYEVYDHRNPEILLVQEAPETATLFIGNEIEYEAPETSVDVAFVAANATLGGYFSEKVSFRGAKLTLKEDSIFLKGIEVYAFEFDNQSQKIEGELTGKVINQEPVK